MAGLLANHPGITNNAVAIRYGLPEVTLYRKAWGMNRDGADIARNGNQAAEKFDNARRTKGVVMLPGGGWSLTPLGGDIITLNTDEFKDAQLPITEFDQGSGGNIISMPVHTFDDSVPGSDVPSNVAGNSIVGMRRMYAANQGYDVSKMTADEAAFPPIDYQDVFQMVTMDRIVRSKASYPENIGFMMGWGGGQGSFPAGPILNFYFGGPTNVTGDHEAGGQYGLQILGRGDARFFERNPFNVDVGKKQWEFRTSFNWGIIGQLGLGLTQLMAIPYGRDHFAFVSPQINAPNLISNGSMTPAAITAIGPGASRVNSAYIESEAVTGHVHTKCATGEGPIRIDSARSARKAWQFSRIIYPGTGLLVDDNLSVKGYVAAGTPLRITMNTFILQDGGAIVATLYNAKTHAACASPSLNIFTLDEGQNEYYFTFSFTRSIDRWRSPILWGFILMIIPLLVLNDSPILLGGRIKSVNISGQSSDPTTETAGVEVKDPANQLTKLQNHDGFRCDIIEYDPSTLAIKSRMFEGDIAAPESTYRGKLQEGRYPNWRDYSNLKFIGLAARLGEQVPLHMVSFFQDYDAPYDTNGQQIQRTWTLPQVIRFLLNDCGVADNEIDIPAFYDVVRLWQSPKLKAEDYTIFPGGDQTYLRLLQKLCKDYLGAYLIRDPNAGIRGMWRVMPQKVSPYDPTLANFYQYRPGYMVGRIGTADAWGTGNTFIRDKSYREEIRRPEINYINVVGVFDIGEDHAPKSKCEAELYNLDSHDFKYPTITANRNHPDFLGRFVPGYLIDPGLIGQKAVDWTARKIFDRAAHAEKWVYWQSPAITINEGSDVLRTYPRHLRINDIAFVQRPNGVFEKVVLRSVSPSWRGSDRVRWANYEGIFV